MPLYIAVRADGMIRGLSPFHPQDVEPLNPGEQLVTRLAYTDEPSSETHAWNPVTFDFEPIPAPPAPPARTTMSRGAWLDRLGTVRLNMLNELQMDPAVPIAVRAQIETMKMKLNVRSAVDVAFSETITSVGQLAGLLVWAKQALSRPEGLEPSEVAAFSAGMLALPLDTEL